MALHGSGQAFSRQSHAHRAEASLLRLPSCLSSPKLGSTLDLRINCRPWLHSSAIKYSRSNRSKAIWASP